MDFNYKKISSSEDLQNLVFVFNIIFETSINPSDESLKDTVSNSSIFNLAAFAGDTIVGGLSAHELKLLSGEKEFYLYDIAVLPEYQKMGVGTNLIDELKKEAKIRNISTIFVEAESEDEESVAFYRSLGQEEISVRHFNIGV